MKELILDCDEVLLQWTNGFKTYHDLTYGTNTKDVVVKTFSLQNAFNCTETEIANRAFNFNCSSSFKNLVPLDGAVDAIKELTKNFKIHIVTKCGTDEDIIKNRLLNLKMVFGDVFSEIHFVPEHQSKYSKLLILKNENTVLFVDDVIENVDTGISAGINSIVFEQPHNIDALQTRTDLSSVKTWVELTKYIKELV